MKNITENIKLSEIVPDENQPRKMFEPEKLKNLIASIKKYGVMSPLTVEKVGEKYLLVDGERRYRASKELGLKEVPATIIAPQGNVDRLVQQFHLQEQHEGWSPTEKASTVYNLSKELGLSLAQIGELLALEPATIKRYVSFANLLEKKEFQKNEIGILWAGPIYAMCNIGKYVYEEKLDKTFTTESRRKLEKKIINEIKKGDMTNPVELTRLKDSVKKSPKSLEEYINGDETVSEVFIRTKARGAYHLRNIMNNANYLGTHIERFLQYPDATPTSAEITKMKNIKMSIEKMLAKVQG